MLRTPIASRYGTVCLSHASRSSCFQLFRSCNRLTRPLCSSSITEPSSLVRVGPPQCSALVLSPRGFARLCFSLHIGATGSCSSVQSPASESHALSTPAATRPVIRHLAGLSQKSYTPLVSTTLDFLTTRHQKVYFRSSLGRTPARVFLALFLPRSPPTAFDRSSWEVV